MLMLNKRSKDLFFDHYSKQKDRVAFFEEKKANWGEQEISLNGRLNSYYNDTAMVTHGLSLMSMRFLMFYGEPVVGEVVFTNMKTSRCHDNSFDYSSELSNNAKLYTGLALSNDGVWRPHSWCVNQNGQIIESTEPREFYYGICLNSKAKLRLFGFIN